MGHVARRQGRAQRPGLVGRKVGDDQAVDARIGRLAHELLHARPVHEGVRGHEADRQAEPLGPQARDHLEDAARRDAGGKRPLVTGLDDRPVGNGVAVRNAEFHQVGGAAVLERPQDEGGAVEARIAGGNERHEGLAVLLSEAGENGVDAVHDTAPFPCIAAEAGIRSRRAVRPCEKHPPRGGETGEKHPPPYPLPQGSREFICGPPSRASRPGGGPPLPRPCRRGPRG